MASTPQAQVKITAKNETQAGLASVSRSVQGMASNISNMFKGLMATAAAMALKNLFKSAVDRAAEAQKALAFVDNALHNIGVNAAEVTPEIKELVDSLALKTGKDREQMTLALSNMIRLTGSYKSGMAGLPVVLDVAAARHMELSKASDITGKAMQGNEKALKKLGVQVRDGETAFQALKRTFNGFAAAEGNTFLGVLGRIKQAWNGVLEALGNALISTDKMGNASGGLIEALSKLAKWIEANQENIAVLTSTALKFVGMAGSGLMMLVSLIRVTVNDVGAYFKLIPETFKEAWGDFVYTLGSGLQEVSDLLDKIGIHVGDGLAQKWTQYGAKLASEARKSIGDIKKIRDEVDNGIWQPKTKAGSHKAIGSIGGDVTGEESAGKAKKEKEKKEKTQTYDDKWKADIEHQEELAKYLDKRSEALTRLNELEEKASLHADKYNDDEPEKLEWLKRGNEAAEARNRIIQEGIDVQEKANQEDQKNFSNGVERLVSLGSLTDQYAASVKGLMDLEATYQAIADDVTRSWDDRAEAQKRANEAHQAHLDLQEKEKAKLEETQRKVELYKDAWRDAWEAVGAGQSVQKAFLNSAKNVIAEVARQKAKYEMGEGVADLATGTWPPNPAALAAAGKHFAAAALFSLVAGAASGGGYGGGSGAAGGHGTRGFDNSTTQQLQGETTLTIKGSFRPNDPQFLDELQTALNAAKGRRLNIAYER